MSLATQARICSEQGRPHEAIELVTEALNLTQETGDQHNQAYVLVTLGHIRRELGASSHALAYYSRAHKIAAVAEDWLPMVEALLVLDPGGAG